MKHAAALFVSLLPLMGCLESPPGASPWLDDVRSDAPARPALPALRAPEAPGNVLLFILEDIGVDKLASYDAHADVPITPAIDGLASSGVVFDRAYANPLCSATRATIQTGRYGFRTGVGGYLVFTRGVGLADEEVTLPELIDAETGGAYDHSYVGKWHLAAAGPDWELHPNTQGYNHYTGSLHGLGEANSLRAEQDYWSWERTTNGELAWSDQYVTVANADDALDAIAGMEEPWVAIVALHAAHDPFHTPPAELHSGVSTGGDPARDQFHWMIESADHELGRVLTTMDPDVLARTTVGVVGDNGTPGSQVSPPLRTGKGNVYEGGIHVPLIVSGYRVASPGRRTDALVQSTDLFATIAELAGVDLEAPTVPAHDGVSFAGVLVDPGDVGMRHTVYLERFEPDGPGPYDQYDQAVVADRYKLVRHLGAPDELYDLQGVVEEQVNLLGQPSLMTPDLVEVYEGLVAALPITP